MDRKRKAISPKAKGNIREKEDSRIHKLNCLEILESDGQYVKPLIQILDYSIEDPI